MDNLQCKEWQSAKTALHVEMMIVSMLNLQVDRFIEDVMGQERMINQVNAVRSIVPCLFDEKGVAEHDTDGHIASHWLSSSTYEQSNGTKLPTAECSTRDHKEYDCGQIKSVLHRFITYILTHPVLYAPRIP